MKSISKSGSLKDFSGIILVNKHPGITSYDIIRDVKRVFF